jgi:hypothetical protein
MEYTSALKNADRAMEAVGKNLDFIHEGTISKDLNKPPISIDF